VWARFETPSEDMPTVDLPDREATTVWGQRLGLALFPNAVVALIGPLGAGKTHLVRAIAAGLGVRDHRMVTSPTFGLIHEYPARLPIFHFDVYRLRSPSEFLDLGPEEYFTAGGVCLIEWADRVEAYLPSDRLRVLLDITGPTSRRLQVETTGPRHESLLLQIAGPI
jgi:tRNA threonylcarbamoyladenosine biosynthesis protein TsaE